MSDDAIQRYEKELAEDPQSRAFAPLAEAYRKAGRLDDAINTARVGLEVHSGYSAGLVVLGRALYEKGELDNAAEILQNAVSESPENYLGQKFLGKVLMDKGENREAMRALESANLLSPEDEEVARLLDEVKSKATTPETMKYEEKEADTESKAQIVTYEQKPTTVDGIELSPLPPGTEDEAFSFSGGGTVDPADITPVPLDIEDVPGDEDVAEVPDDEMDADEMTATVVEEEDVEQAMDIESIDELGPEVAAFIQEGENVVVESMEDPSDDVSAADVDPVGEFVIEIEDIPPAVSGSGVEQDPAPPASVEAPPEPVFVPEMPPTPSVTEVVEGEPEPASASEPAPEPQPSPEAAFEVVPEPVPAPPVSGDASSEPAAEPEIPPAPSFTETVGDNPEATTAPEPAPEPTPGPGAAFEVDPEAGPDTGPLFIPEPEPELEMALEPVPAAVSVPEIDAEPAPGFIAEQATEPPPAPEPSAEGQFSTETLADLYAQQGLIEKAVGMYQQILEQDPGNEAAKLKLDALEPEMQPETPSIQEIHPPAEGQAESPPGHDADDALSILEGLLENVERIKQP